MARSNMRVAAVLAGAIMAAAGCAFDGTTDPPVDIDLTTQGDFGGPFVPQPFPDGELLTDPGLEDLEDALCVVGNLDLEPIAGQETPGPEMPEATVRDAARGDWNADVLECRLVGDAHDPMMPPKVVCTTPEAMTLDEAVRMDAPIANPGDNLCDQNPDECEHFEPVPIEAYGPPGQEMHILTIEDVMRNTLDLGALECELVEGANNPMGASKVVCHALDDMTIKEAAQWVGTPLRPETAECGNLEGGIPMGCEPYETPIIDVYAPCDVPRG